MFDAQLLYVSGEGEPVFSPWFPRSADSAIFTLDVVAINGAKIEVAVFTKSSDDTGNGADATLGTKISSTSAGRTSQEWQSSDTKGLEELVRFRYMVLTEAISPPDRAWVLFRMLSPVWFDAVLA